MLKTKIVVAGIVSTLLFSVYTVKAADINVNNIIDKNVIAFNGTELTRIKADKTSITLDPKNTRKTSISVTAIYANNSQVYIDIKELTIKSSDTSVVVINKDGTIEAQGAGSADVTVQYKDKSITIPVFVKGIVPAPQPKEYPLSDLLNNAGQFNDILSKSTSHDLGVKVPKKYIDSIDILSNSSGFTNIDVYVEKEVKTLTAKVSSLKDELKGNKKNDYFNISAMGLKKGDEVEVTAKDENGKILDKKVFRIKDSRKISYLGDGSYVNNKAYKLYDLMYDTTLFNSILQDFSLGELNLQVPKDYIKGDLNLYGNEYKAKLYFQTEKIVKTAKMNICYNYKGVSEDNLYYNLTYDAVSDNNGGFVCDFNGLSQDALILVKVYDENDTLLQTKSIEYDSSMAQTLMSDEVIQNQSFSLPSTTKVRDSEGNTVEGTIVWDNDKVDTSKVGIFVYKGKVKDYNKNIIQALTVKPVATIDPIEVALNQNDTYYFPNTVIEKLSDGTTKEVSVSWNNTGWYNTVDTSKAGTVSYEGTVDGYADKVKLNVNVGAIISSIDSMSQDVSQNEPYTLPTTVKAKYTDGTSKDVPVTWDSTSVDTTKVDTYNLKGKVEGYNYEVSLQVNVKLKVLSIEDINLNISQNDYKYFPSTVKATLSDGTTKDLYVTWDNKGAWRIDTSTCGTQTFNGTVSGYTGVNTVKLIATVGAKVSSIDTINVTTNQGDYYSLPSTVAATMSDGSVQNVSVTWDKTTVNTSTPGSYTFTGKTSDGYSVYLYLTVKTKVTGINDINKQVSQGDYLYFPSTVDCTLADGSTKSLAVVWNNNGASKVDTSKVGTQTFTGTVDGYSGSINLIVTVSAKISTISDTSISINKGDSLPATVKATLSDGSTKDVSVTWNGYSYLSYGYTYWTGYVDTSTVGTYRYRGSVTGYSGYVYINVTVKEAVKISSIQGITAAINQNDVYTMPTTVKATMSDGTTKDISVVWNNNNVSTATAGVYTYTGTVVGYTGSVSLQLTVNKVAKITAIESINTTVNQGGLYTLPTTVKAKMDDGTTSDVTVVWNNYNVSTATPGVYSYTGTVAGYSGSVSLNLTVNSTTNTGTITPTVTKVNTNGPILGTTIVYIELKGASDPSKYNVTVKGNATSYVTTTNQFVVGLVGNYTISDILATDIVYTLK